MNNQKYKFSIIIPIYNVEEYLAEAIESVIKQTIGFKENIQMILVNDGSPDNSEAICLKYQKEYPENIIYVKKENGGVSSARNKGLEYAEGKYINFLDSDDKWEINALKNAYDFFEKHYEEIDILGCIIEFFEGRKGLDHPLNYKFDKNKVVDIFNYYDHIQLSSASCFIKREALGKLRFNEEIKYSEDALFLTELTLQKEKIGFINNANYLYRKRLSENSAIQTKNKTDDWYTRTKLQTFN